MALVDAAIARIDSCSVVFDTIQFATVTMYKPIRDRSPKWIETRCIQNCTAIATSQHFRSQKVVILCRAFVAFTIPLGSRSHLAYLPSLHIYILSSYMHSDIDTASIYDHCIYTDGQCNSMFYRGVNS